LEAGGYAQLGEDALDVAADGGAGDGEVAGDLLAGAAFADQGEDLVLAGR
jgi:hypothetical protein